MLPDDLLSRLTQIELTELFVAQRLDFEDEVKRHEDAERESAKPAVWRPRSYVEDD